ASSPDKPRPQTYGHGALAEDAARTVTITMGDDLHFDPASIAVRNGEVVTFRVVNAGKTLHELTLGRPDAQDLHEAQMAQMAMTGRSADRNMDMAGMDHSRRPSTPGHKKYMKRLAVSIVVLDRLAAAIVSAHVPQGQRADA